MTRAQAVLARAMGIPAGTALPAYVQGRATEVDYLLQRSRLPAGHPVVQAHVAGIISDWRLLEAAVSMERSALDVLKALGQATPRPPASRRGMLPRPVWTVMSMAWTGRPDAEALPDVVLARADEIIRLLRDARLPAEHPTVRAHAGRIAAECRAQEAAKLGRTAARALRAWKERPAWKRVLDDLGFIFGHVAPEAVLPPAHDRAGGK